MQRTSSGTEQHPLDDNSREDPNCGVAPRFLLAGWVLSESVCSSSIYLFIRPSLILEFISQRTESHPWRTCTKQIIAAIFSGTCTFLGRALSAKTALINCSQCHLTQSQTPLTSAIHLTGGDKASLPIPFGLALYQQNGNCCPATLHQTARPVLRHLVQLAVLFPFSIPRRIQCFAARYIAALTLHSPDKNHPSK